MQSSNLGRISANNNFLDYYLNWLYNELSKDSNEYQNLLNESEQTQIIQPLNSNSGRIGANNNSLIQRSNYLYNKINEYTNEILRIQNSLNGSEQTQPIYQSPPPATPIIPQSIPTLQTFIDHQNDHVPYRNPKKRASNRNQNPVTFKLIYVPFSTIVEYAGNKIPIPRKAEVKDICFDDDTAEGIRLSVEDLFPQLKESPWEFYKVETLKSYKVVHASVKPYEPKSHYLVPADNVSTVNELLQESGAKLEEADLKNDSADDEIKKTEQNMDHIKKNNRRLFLQFINLLIRTFYYLYT
ncbi:hypothetical protein C1645_826144 [Glomus cerebriforme]|uniref:Uncharacterized protein n=1 Tax=Glomus cerebriforme TaxID=658196 RepID=A0A397SVB0_9GLOM|nr:hypothetical protein C1645_826144 [Glomus cerebriforme]